PHQLLRVLNQLLVPAHRLLMVGLADDVLRYFVKLMDTEDTACIFAIGTGLLPETGTEANEGQRQIFDFENLILVHTGDRDFGSTDEKEFFALDSVDLIASLGELPVADKAEIA